MSQSNQLLPNEAKDEASVGFKRWEDHVEKEDLRKFDRMEIEQKEKSRRENFSLHKTMIQGVLISGVRNVKRYFHFQNLKPVRAAYPGVPFVEDSTIGLPRIDGNNIFDAIFLKDKVSTPEEKIAFAELLIENYGYVQYVTEILKPENQKILDSLLSDKCYAEFLQRFYIHYLRTQGESTILLRVDTSQAEKSILTALATHYKDGGKQLFLNFTSSNNVSKEILKRFINDHNFLCPHLNTLNLKVFQREIIMLVGVYHSEGNHRLISQDADAHKKILGILLSPEDPEDFDKSKVYAYLKVYFDQFNDYLKVIQACDALKKQLNNDFSCSNKYDQAVKKYADLRILVIAKQISASEETEIDKTIPQEVKQFLNPGNRNASLMPARSSFHLIDRFFSNPAKAAEALNAKEERVEARFKRR